MGLCTLTQSVPADTIPSNYLQKNSDAGLLSLSHCSAVSQKPSTADMDCEMESNLSQFIRRPDAYIAAWIKRRAFA